MCQHYGTLVLLGTCFTAWLLAMYTLHPMMQGKYTYKLPNPEEAAMDVHPECILFMNIGVRNIDIRVMEYGDFCLLPCGG